MKFVIGVASKGYYEYSMAQLKELEKSNKSWDKDSLEKFKEDLLLTLDTIREYTDIPLELEEVKYCNGEPKLKYVANINTLEQLIELNKKCNIVMYYEEYSLPYIQFYDSCIE